MRSIILIVILATSASSFHNFGSPDGNDDLIHPPWWIPRSTSGPGDSPGSGRGGFGQPNGGGGFGQPGGGRWHPWGKPNTSTNKPRVTYPIFQPTNPTTEIPTSRPGSSTPKGIDLVIESCKAACLVTSEHNPVCGTDNVTYANIGRLECARQCGVDVKLKRKSRCATPIASTPPPNNNNGDNGRADRLSALEACKRNCPVTSEYNPVCGTDNVTYTNPGRLDCARRCGANVQVSRRSSCNVPVIIDVIAACIQTCSVTPEYNPVCGTDGVTYNNPGRLECVRNCGRKVEIRRRSPCSVPPGPNNPDLPGTTESPNGNGNGGSNWNGNGNGNGGSKGNGNGNGGSNWNGNGNGNGNGGSNGNGNGGSNWNGNGNGNGNGGSNGNGNGNGNGGSNGNGNGNGGWNGNGNGGGNSNGNGNGKTPSMTEIIACMQLCPITPEINPVCGTDGVTYSNPGKLLCTQFCGVNVRVRKFAPCLGQPIPTPHPFVCPTLPPVGPINPSTQDCINKCSVSQEFKPVCGSNGITYINIQSLQCNIRCGVAVSVQKMSACGEASTNPTVVTPATPATPPVWANTDRPTQPTVDNTADCIIKCNPSNTYKPVCGTNGETYANLQNLQCAKRCGINVDVKSMSACSSNPYVDGSKDENTTVPNDLGFTIPADILASIFPSWTPNTTQSSTISDSEENYDLDQRFGENTK